MPLLFTRHNKACEDRDHSAVHRHRNRDLIKRDAIKQDLHILNRVDRHTGFTNIAHNARMVAVVATVCGKIESNRNALLPCGQRLAVKCVAFFSC